MPINNQVQERMLCPVCDARLRAGMYPVECERCGGDGTATKVDAHARVGATGDGRVRSERRPMTEAEEKLVEHTVAWLNGDEPIPEFEVLGRPIVTERKPPEPRPITPEELAVIEVAKGVTTGEWPDSGSAQAESLKRAVRRLK